MIGWVNIYILTCLAIVSSADHKTSAGVTGLTSAWFLAEAGYEVTVIATHVPGDESIEYTSPWYVCSSNSTEAMSKSLCLGPAPTGEPQLRPINL